MRQLRILPINGDIHNEVPDFYLIQELETHKYFTWRYDELTKAQSALENLETAWEKDVLEKPRDLFVNFVEKIEQTLFQRRE